MTDRLFSISVNNGIIDKPPKGATVEFARGWESLERTEAEIIEDILAGRAVAPQYRHGYRKTSNFIRSGFIAADVDAGIC